MRKKKNVGHADRGWISPAWPFAAHPRPAGGGRAAPGGYGTETTRDSDLPRLLTPPMARIVHIPGSD